MLDAAERTLALPALARDVALALPALASELALRDAAEA